MEKYFWTNNEQIQENVDHLLKTLIFQHKRIIIQNIEFDNNGFQLFSLFHGFTILIRREYCFI